MAVWAVTLTKIQRGRRNWSKYLPEIRGHKLISRISKFWRYKHESLSSLPPTWTTVNTLGHKENKKIQVLENIELRRIVITEQAGRSKSPLFCATSPHWMVAQSRHQSFLAFLNSCFLFLSLSLSFFFLSFFFFFWFSLFYFSCFENTWNNFVARSGWPNIFP